MKKGLLGVLLGMLFQALDGMVSQCDRGVITTLLFNRIELLIDTFNRLREEGVEAREAVLKTSAQRLRPIMLTTITTILGLLPMAFQINMNFIERTIAYGGITSVWWVQLSTAVISGLAFATLLTLIVIPSMLAMPTNIAMAFRWTFRLKTADLIGDHEQIVEQDPNFIGPKLASASHRIPVEQGDDTRQGKERGKFVVYDGKQDYSEAAE